MLSICSRLRFKFSGQEEGHLPTGIGGWCEIPDDIYIVDGSSSSNPSVEKSVANLEGSNIFGAKQSGICTKQL